MINNKKESTKSIYLLLIPIIACLVFFISCEKTIKVVPLDNSEQTHLNYTEDGKISWTDTLIVFNEETFEEELHLHLWEMIPEEYTLFQEVKDVDITGELNETEYKQYLNERQVDVGQVESAKLLSHKIEAFRDLYNSHNSHTGQASERIDNPQRDGAKITSEVLKKVPFDDNSILLTVVDTIITFNADTFEESIQIVESQITLAEYEKRQADTNN